MNAFRIFLRATAPIFLLVCALHLVLGLGADVVLGAKIPIEVIADPALDSQNRFYGISFALYGVLLWLCASDVAKYASVLRRILWVLFAAGAARLVSVVLHGLPPPLVVVLLFGELAMPPVILWWLSRVLVAQR
jgi:Domain of unknown function (DUF4345)